ncbi:RimK family alpha-L-glutamate ligase [Kitasatospora sp. GP82]|uniref:RimK family alpha-L-glutamate ligase n=1 Tax=Kitasatospora sp. GP82 TaxID=3035089 RepID=UPI002474D2DF|nr:RimK family alpha-L-glutamate ligase [Kitasatospora sp. GP82]MDH6125398.1 RimK family alpha-L-glutamate ligase [Kitasatospora sp. GP82]
MSRTTSSDGVSNPGVDRSRMRRDASVWLLIGSGLEQTRVAAEVAAAFALAFGEECATVRTADLLLGVRAGQLTLGDLDGRPVAAPAVAYARMSTPRLRTDCEVTLLRQLQAMGTVLLNPIDAVLACANKFWQLQELALAGLPVPDTLTYTDAPLSRVISAGIEQPCVVKAVRGQRGGRVFLAPTADMLRDIHGSLSNEVPYLFQHYLEHSHGRDLRVVVVDGRAVAAQVRRATDGGFKSNLALGGESTYCLGRYPEAEELAVRAVAVIGLGVAGVDLLFRPDGGFTLCEVNANVSWRETMSEIAPAVATACAARLRPDFPNEPNGQHL